MRGQLLALGGALGALMVFVSSPAVADEASADAAAADRPAAPDSDGGAAANAAIRAALQRPISVEFVETPLWDVVDFLRSTAKVEMQIDARVVENAGLGSDTPVTLSLSGVSLRSLLRIMLRELDLTYIVHDEVILITTPEEADSRLSTRVIPVRDLVWDKNAQGEIVEDYDSLIELATRIVNPESWNTLGGPATISPLLGTLVVSQTDDGFEQLKALLAAMRSIPRLEDTAADTKLPPAVLASQDQQPWRKRFDDALQASTDLEFVETPLADVAAFLARLHKIPVILDTRSLDNAGIGSDVPITSRQQGTSLGSALRRLLRDLDLTFVVADEVLLITTPEEAQSRLQIVLYLVGDIVGQPGAGGSVFDRYDDLISTITATVAPHTWPEMTGPGPIDVFPSRGVLVIAQTAEVHTEIGQLLTALREAQRQLPQLPAAPPADPAALVTRSYRLMDNAADLKAEEAVKVPEIVTRIITPGEWTDEPGSPIVRAIGARLIVHHRPIEQQRIERLLVEMGLLHAVFE